MKLADKSDARWLVVDEYESDELVENSEDDKKIRKAQDKAVRKKQIEQARSKRQQTNPSSSTMVHPEDQQLFRGGLLIFLLSL